MIVSFKSRDVRELWENGRSRRIDTKLARRAMERLTVLNAANDLRDLHLHGYELHKWAGHTDRWSISVSGHWRITFTWIKGEAHDVDLEQPH